MSSSSESSQTTLLLADWIAPMDQPILRDAGIAFRDGIILSVGSANQLRRQHSGATITRLPETVLLPGLVNAHVHLELSTHTPGPPPKSFVDWLLKLIPRQPQTPRELQTQTGAAVTEGINQCLRFGVMTVGDISRLCSITRPLLKNSSLRVMSFGEVLAMAQRRGVLEERLASAAETTEQADRLHVGISPHSPYSVEAHGYRRCLEVARSRSMPLATHLAESADEAEFLASHSGPFRQLWNELGAWDDQVPTFAGGPIRFAQSLGLLDYPTVLAHVNYCDDEELALLARGKASVVYCPRTHAYFGHPPHRWRDILAAGVNVALGTDSTVSSPDLNLVDDLRLIHRLAPDVPADILWELATIRAARALGLDQKVGSLTPGTAADIVAFRNKGAVPLLNLLEDDAIPTAVWSSGKNVARAPRP
jgi:cytosine/adenosine deaminase-related metal-dependent hydrolase